MIILNPTIANGIGGEGDVRQIIPTLRHCYVLIVQYF